MGLSLYISQGGKFGKAPPPHTNDIIQAVKFPEINVFFLNFINNSFSEIELINLSLCKFCFGDRLNINFTLDDENKTEIDLIGVVKHMNDRYIGCDLQNVYRFDTPS
jgi:hypothetical protein